jgi:hypothetical protein
MTNFSARFLGITVPPKRRLKAESAHSFFALGRFGPGALDGSWQPSRRLVVQQARFQRDEQQSAESPRGLPQQQQPSEPE